MRRFYQLLAFTSLVILGSASCSDPTNDDIVIGFDSSIADGLVGPNDGLVGAGELTLAICGSVNEAGALVDVSIDGGSPEPATVTGTTWCLDDVVLSESPPAHDINVTASLDMRTGTGALSLSVDLEPPPAADMLAAITPNRQAVELSWISGDDNGVAASAYLVKYATEPLDADNFDTTGNEVPSPSPQPPGTTETVLIEQLDAGTSYYFGVVTFDAVGNRSAVETIGPVIPDFDGTGAILPVDPAAGDNALGLHVAAGDLNGDGYSDIAVAAPYKTVGGDPGAGAVYVYFGGSAGLGNPIAPDVTIEGVGSGVQFGNAIAVGDMDGDTTDDLIVGAPFADNANGRVYVFRGGAGFASLTGVGDADAEIGVAGGWFTSGFLGWSLTTARFDDDANDDLFIGVPGGGDGEGGVAVVFGGSGETLILLDDTDPTGSGTAKTLVISDPEPTPWDLFGFWLHNLGPTEGGDDGDDDIGMAYFDSPSAFIVRGRAQPAPAGVTMASVDPLVDLEIQNDSADVERVFFGASMGTLSDQNGDDAREVIIGQWGEGPYNGRVSIVDGDEVGVHDVGTAPFMLTEIRRGVGVRGLGSAIFNNATADLGADIDNDGSEDLVIVAGSGVMGMVPVSAFIWYGGNIPAGPITTDTADHVIVAPPTFTGDPPGAGGTPIAAIWAGDVNDDGLEDMCWADHIGNDADGSFELLWDDGM